ncbi:MAG: OmpA family protein [Paludibacteraceae bacterium]
MKRLFILLLATTITFGTFAQNDTIYNGAGRATDDWFLSLMVGGDILFNQSRQQNPNIDATNGMRPEISLSAGKWVMPYFGLQLGIKSFWWQGAASSADLLKWNFEPQQITPLFDGSSNFNIFYVNPHIDVLLSISSCINRGYLHTCKWDVIPHIGIGYLYGSTGHNSPALHSLTGHFGLTGKYRINENWDINLSLATTIMAEGYTVHAGPVTQEDLAVSVGFSYNFGGHRFAYKQQNKNDDTARQQNHDKYTRADTIHVYHHTERVIERGAPITNTDLAAAAITNTFDQPFQIALIEFTLGAAEPKQNYATQYYNVAAFVNAYPDVTLRLDAYCDKDTGTPEINDRLAQQRAETVRNILVNEYGVPADCITVNPLGDREQVYEEGALNRIVRITVLPQAK